MDEGLLNDLLECSVCLERLDTSSRVLPCQHTFCLKCLKVIVESHKELRCPECRILVETKVEELPPNVLLMRILEGMRNSAPRKAGGTHRALRTGHALATQSGQPARDLKQIPPHARAMYDYISKEQGDLSFKKGETILLHKKLDPYWYQGECSGRTGVFPITYVQVVVPLQVPTALCKALYDFRMSAPDEEGCLAFDKGAIITVHRRVDENWAEGRLEQRVGIFPIAFVELNQAARQLMNTAPLNRAVPPLPDHGRVGHSEHRHHTQHAHRYQPMSTSMPVSAPANYQNVSMSHSHPNYGAGVGGGAVVGGTAVMLGPLAEGGAKHALELVHLGKALPRVETRPHTETKPPDPPSDTSSSATPSAPTASDSSDTTEPSLPSSPDHRPPATNTALNVSLPPPRASPEPPSPAPASTPASADAARPSADSLLEFGVGLQAALSPAPERPRDLLRDKRHSLTPANNTAHAHTNQNRHSAEIVATSLLDHVSEPRERRRRRERSSDRTLPAAYVAIYPYKPQKPDELELKKGGVYTVNERCRDGWYKGWCGRSQRVGVFPGNYVAPAPLAALHTPAHAHSPASTHTHNNVHKPMSNNVSKNASNVSPPAPPDAPPRAHSPPGQPMSYPWNSQSQSQQSTPRSEKSKEKSRVEKSSISSGVSLMKRLAAMKKCKSPPPAGYSLDNPVFEDTPGTSLMLLSAQHQPLHVRSGSCPSQLLRALPATTAPTTATTAATDRADRRHKERHHEHHLAHRSNTESPWQSQHRKSQSLDVTAARRDRHHSQTVKERFRCIVPYPPNSEYELELKVDDIVIVCKKRGDGWYKGTLQRTGRTGLFPASFVQSCPHE